MNSKKVIFFFFFAIISIAQTFAQEPAPQKSSSAEEKQTIAPPPPPPPPPPSVGREVFSIVENMPYLDECAGIRDRQKQKTCNEEALLEKIYRHLEYPAIARENGVEGIVQLKYIVNKEGEIEEVKISRDIGAECGKAAKMAMEKVAEEITYQPGMMRSRVVLVGMQLEVEFTKEKFKKMANKKSKEKEKPMKEKPEQN